MEQTTKSHNGVALERPTEGRSVAGVAAAIANYFNIPVGFVRAGLVISVFFGGIGLAAYGAGWVAIREEGEDESLVERWLSNASSPSSWLGLGLVALAIVIVVGSIEVFSGSTLFAAVLVVAGILLYRGVFDDGMPTLSSNRPTPPGGRASVVVAEDDAESPVGPSVDAAADQGATDLEEERAEEDLKDAHDELAMEIPVEGTAGGGAGVPPSRTRVVVPPRRRRQRSRLGRFTLSALLISLGSLAVLDTADVVGFSVSDYFAVALVVVGVGLGIGALWGRAYTLILLGLILVVFVQVTSWFNIPLGGGFGDPMFSPTSVAELDSEYRLLAGQMTLDLSNLPTSGTLTTDVSIGAGELTILLPDDMNVVVESRVVAGEVNTPDANYNGTDLTRTYQRRPAGATGTLIIDASIGFGQLNIHLER